MSAPNYLLTEEQLLCCICLDVFTDPVTLPCGHNFCKDCITEHLNFNSQHHCPMCKERVDRKYKLGVNTFISEMAVQFRQSAGKKARRCSEKLVAQPEKVFADVPARTKLKSLKSLKSLKFCMVVALCLTCLSILFAVKLQLHQTVSNLKTNHLFDDAARAAVSVCTKHGKPLELYCKNEQTPICRSCAESSHRLHDVVPLKAEYKVKRVELRNTEARIQRKIHERQLKIQEIRHSIVLSEDAADREAAEGAQVFTALIQSLERAQVELIQMIKEKQTTTEKQAKGFIQELEQEVSELTRRRDEAEQLSRLKDPLHFLQIFPSLSAAPLTKDWTDVSICPTLYEGLLRTALVGAVEELTTTVKKEMGKRHETELASVREIAADVTLDPETAHPALILSKDGKQVYCGEIWNKLPNNSKRFESTISVLGKQGFSCGRAHYDVQVKGKTGWTLGVARESVNRKGEVTLNPENGYWSICLRNSKDYFALADRPVPLPVNNRLEKVRVFVDYEEGRVSFYDVAAAELLYSFTDCSFTERLCPFFSPGASDGGRNSAPLIISPVSQ